MLRFVLSCMFGLVCACESPQSGAQDEIANSTAVTSASYQERVANPFCYANLSMSDELNAQGVRCGYRLTLSNLVLPDCRSLGVAIRDFLQERSSLLSQRALAPIDYSHFGPLELLGRRKVLFHNLTVSSRLEGSLKTVANSGQVIVLLRSWDTISKGNKRPFYWLELSVPVKGEYLGPAQITLYGMQPLCNHISEQTQQLGASEDKVVAEILGNPKANPMLDISDKIGELIDDFNATECDRSMFVGTGAKRGLSF